MFSVALWQCSTFYGPPPSVTIAAAAATTTATAAPPPVRCGGRDADSNGSDGICPAHTRTHTHTPGPTHTPRKCCGPLGVGGTASTPPQPARQDRPFAHHPVWKTPNAQSPSAIRHSNMSANAATPRLRRRLVRQARTVETHTLTRTAETHRRRTDHC